MLATLGELVLQMKDLLQFDEAGVRAGSAEVDEELRHLGLPAGIDLGAGHAGLGLLQRVGFEVADQQAVWAQEQGVIAPAGRRQRLEHLGPNRAVPVPILVEAFRADLKLEADSSHHKLFRRWGGAPAGVWIRPRPEVTRSARVGPSRLSRFGPAQGGSEVEVVDVVGVEAGR